MSAFVQRQNVQLQFQKLQQDRESFRSSVEVADSERERVELELQALQRERNSLITKKREAQAALGSFHGQRESWNEETARLTRQIREEREELVSCAQEAETIEGEETKMDKNYVRDMKEMNEAQMDLLGKLEVSRVETLIMPETVEELRRIWVEKEGDRRWMGAMQVNDETMHDSPLGFEESCAVWHQASKKWSEEQEANERLQQQILAFQNAVLKNDRLGVSQDQLVHEEERWKDAGRTGSVHPSSRGGRECIEKKEATPQDMHLEAFYGD